MNEPGAGEPRSKQGLCREQKSVSFKHIRDQRNSRNPKP